MTSGDGSNGVSSSAMSSVSYRTATDRQASKKNDIKTAHLAAPRANWRYQIAARKWASRTAYGVHSSKPSIYRPSRIWHHQRHLPSGDKRAHRITKKKKTSSRRRASIARASWRKQSGISIAQWHQRRRGGRVGNNQTPVESRHRRTSISGARRHDGQAYHRHGAHHHQCCYRCNRINETLSLVKQ